MKSRGAKNCMKSNIKKYLIVLLGLLIITLICIFANLTNGKNLEISMDINSDSKTDDIYKVYYLFEGQEDFSEAQISAAEVKAGKKNSIKFGVPNNAVKIRVDVGNQSADVEISNIKIYYGKKDITPQSNVLYKIDNYSGINEMEMGETIINISSVSDDPYFVWDVSEWNLSDTINYEITKMNWILKIIASAAVMIIVSVFAKKYEMFSDFYSEVFHSKKLTMQLAKNDFKTKYAGSYLGIVWAFVQPIVTVLVYWFVFEKGLRSGNMVNVPFVLWLIAGLVPWFFFSDALNSGTNSLIEYQYLVKKVVFQINILPIVKVCSALFVHIFFILFTVGLYCCYGYFPDFYTLQVIYYTFCVAVFTLGLCYATSAIVGFFRDLSQIIGILLQVGVWMTPIMWNIETMGLPGWLRKIFMANPLYYIVSGYRDALINKVWFWDRMGLTLYFWIVTLFIFGAGTIIFKKLKIHFADVL